MATVRGGGRLFAGGSCRLLGLRRRPRSGHPPCSPGQASHRPGPQRGCSRCRAATAALGRTRAALAWRPAWQASRQRRLCSGGFGAAALLAAAAVSAAAAALVGPGHRQDVGYARPAPPEPAGFGGTWPPPRLLRSGLAFGSGRDRLSAAAASPAAQQPEERPPESAPFPSAARAAARISATDIFFFSAISRLAAASRSRRESPKTAGGRDAKPRQKACFGRVCGVRDFFHELLLTVSASAGVSTSASPGRPIHRLAAYSRATACHPPRSSVRRRGRKPREPRRKPFGSATCPPRPP